MSSPISNAAIATSMAQDAEDKMEVGEIGDAEVSVATKEIGSGSTVPSSALAATNDTTGSAAPQTTVTSSATTKSSSSGPPSAVEFEPPVACVRRILKKTLPSSSNVGKDAVAAFARASGIFIIYLTACANDFARENRRQTITANDVLAAIKELEFDEFAPELTTFLERYRELEKTKKNIKAKAAAERAKEANGEKTNDEGVPGPTDASAPDGVADEKPKTKEDEGADDDESTSPQSPKSKGEDDEDDDDKTNTNDADGDASMGQEEEGGDNDAVTTASATTNADATTTSNDNEEEAGENDMTEEGNADDTNTMEE